MGHLLTLVCNVLFSKKYDSGGGYLKEYKGWVICLLWSILWSVLLSTVK